MANGSNSFSGDLFVAGTLSPSYFTPPAHCIGANAIITGAGLNASDLQHQYQPVYATDHSVTAATARQVIHVVRGTTGLIVQFQAGCTVACIGNSTITVSLLKNGTDILAADIVLDSTDALFVLETDSGFTSNALLAGDVLEVSVAVSVSSGTLGKGLFAQLAVREDAQ